MSLGVTIQWGVSFLCSPENDFVYAGWGCRHYPYTSARALRRGIGESRLVELGHRADSEFEVLDDHGVFALATTEHRRVYVVGAW